MLMFASVSRCCADIAELLIEVFSLLSCEARIACYSGVHFVSLVSECVCVYFSILLHMRLKELDTFKTCITLYWDPQFLIFLSFKVLNLQEDIVDSRVEPKRAAGNLPALSHVVWGPRGDP